LPESHIYFLFQKPSQGIEGANPIIILIYPIIPVIEFLKPLFEQFVSDEIVSMFTDNIIFYSARGFLFLTVLAGLLKMVFALSRKRFRFYFAKCCLSIAKNGNDYLM
jgi:hypothetical protein